jgi:hypothetical protein
LMRYQIGRAVQKFQDVRQFEHSEVAGASHFEMISLTYFNLGTTRNDGLRRRRKNRWDSNNYDATEDPQIRSEQWLREYLYNGLTYAQGPEDPRKAVILRDELLYRPMRLKFMHEIQAPTDKYFIDVDGMPDDRLKDLVTHVAKCLDLCYRIVPDKKSWRRNGESEAELDDEYEECRYKRRALMVFVLAQFNGEGLRIPGKFHLVYPFLLMNETRVKAFHKFAFTDNRPNWMDREATWVDCNARVQRHLRMPLMYKVDKFKNIVFAQYTVWKIFSGCDKVQIAPQELRYNMQWEIPFYTKLRYAPILSWYDPSTLYKLACVRSAYNPITNFVPPILLADGPLREHLDDEATHNRNLALLLRSQAAPAIARANGPAAGFDPFLHSSTDFYSIGGLLQYVADGRLIQERESAEARMAVVNAECDDNNHRQRKTTSTVVTEYLNRYFAVIVNDLRVTIVQKVPASSNSYSGHTYVKKKVEDFFKRMDNCKLFIPDITKPLTKNLEPQYKLENVGKIWFRDYNRREYDKVIHRPLNPNAPKTTHGAKELNTFVYSMIPAEECAKYAGVDLSPFFDMMFRLFDCRADVFYYTLNFFTYIVNFPWEKMGYVPCFVGPEGTGKTFMADTFGRILGSQYLFVDNVDYVTRQFNSILHGKTFVLLDDALYGDNYNKNIGHLKSMVTNHYLMVEEKFAESEVIDNCLNFMILSNISKTIPTGPTSRRYTIANCPYWYTFASETEKGDYWRYMTIWAKGPDGDYRGVKALGNFLRSPNRLQQMKRQKFNPFQQMVGNVSLNIRQKEQYSQTWFAFIKEMVVSQSNVNRLLSKYKDKEENCPVISVLDQLHSGKSVNLFIPAHSESDKEQLEQFTSWPVLQQISQSTQYPKWDSLYIKQQQVQSAWVRYITCDELMREYRDFHRKMYQDTRKKPCSSQQLLTELKEFGVITDLQIRQYVTIHSTRLERDEHGQMAPVRKETKEKLHIYEFLPWVTVRNNFFTAQGLYLDNASVQEEFSQKEAANEDEDSQFTQNNNNKDDPNKLPKHLEPYKDDELIMLLYKQAKTEKPIGLQHHYRDLRIQQEGEARIAEGEARNNARGDNPNDISSEDSSDDDQVEDMSVEDNVF